MSNTTIQIKRSSVTTAPTTLATAEPAYSYLSDKLFIGNAAGNGTIAIGGKYFVDQLNVAFGVTNSAYNYANTLSSDLSNTTVSANNYAGAMANAANAYAAATYLPFTGGTLTGDLTVQANLTVTGTTTFVNTQSLLVSDNIFVLNADLDNATAPTQDAGMQVNRGSSFNVGIIWNETTEKWTFSNDGTNYLDIGSESYAAGVGVSANNYAGVMANSANAYAESIGVNANTFASSVGVSANVYADAVGVSANVYADAVGVSANAYAALVAGYANTNAANASYLSTGTVVVARGGTGVNSITANAVLIGSGTDPIQTVSSSTEGHVLQINSVGVPTFGVLDGGAF